MRYLDELMCRFPTLVSQKEVLQQSIELLASQFRQGSKLLICGNGGSAADADHIAGELMKGFIKKRPLSEEMKRAFEEVDPLAGRSLADSLQCGLPVLNLASHTAFSTAFSNDLDFVNAFAQLTTIYGRPGDILLAISTSGNSENVLRAVVAAKAMGLYTIGLSGGSGGRLHALTDQCIIVPESETYKIQELHLPIYHMMCLELEEIFF